MKKLGFIILGFLLGAMLTYYFCPRPLDVEEEISIIKPNGVISVTQAKALNANWSQYREAAVDSAAKKQGRNKDNRWTHWSIDDIENYIAYSKDQADSLGYEMTGIRVYLGVYGDNAGQTKKNLTTMFIVPTGKKSNMQASSLINFMPPPNNDLSIDPLNDGTGGGNGYSQ